MSDELKQCDECGDVYSGECCICAVILTKCEQCGRWGHPVDQSCPDSEKFEGMI